MATKALSKPVRGGTPIKEVTFQWEGRDRAGKTIRGEMRAGGEAVVTTTLRRQGIAVTKVRKQRYQELIADLPRCTPYIYICMY